MKKIAQLKRVVSAMQAELSTDISKLQQLREKRTGEQKKSVEAAMRCLIAVQKAEGLIGTHLQDLSTGSTSIDEYLEAKLKDHLGRLAHLAAELDKK